MTLIYTIAAEENYDPDTIITFSEDAWNWPLTAQCYVGLSYYRAARDIIYTQALTPVANIQTNTTGFNLWSGQSEIASGDTYNANQRRFHYVLTKNIDNQSVTRGDTYDPTSVVPVGVQGLISGTLVGGSGYVDGVYGAFTLTGGSGTLGFGVARVTSGVVTSFDIYGAPSGYMVGDVLSTPNTNLGGSGSGFTFTITAIDFTSDGTARRFTEMDNTINNFPSMVDPWTGNVWEHALMDFGQFVCGVYLFPRDKNYGQQISPLFPSHGDGHMEPLGFTENYFYVYEDQTGDSWISASPRIPASVEITADRLLPYFWFPSPFTSASFYQACFSTNNKVYIYSYNQVGARQFNLYRLDEPSAAGPMNSATVGGALTDITPWSTADGPNTNAASYTTDDSTQNYNVLQPFYLPATNLVVLLTKFFPQDISGGGTQSDLFFHCTYVTSPDGGSPGFEQHSNFITGFLDASLGPLASTGNLAPTGAAWAVVNCQQLNAYANNSSFNYTDLDYTKRWLALTVQAVNPGDTFVPPGLTPSDSTLIIHVQYQFTLGSAPSVVTFYTENGWDTQLVANPDYTGLMTNPNKAGSLVASGYVQGANHLLWDVGLYDDQDNAFWWSGQTNNMVFVSQPFYDRHFGSNFHPMPPLLRLGFGEPTPTFANGFVRSYVGNPQL